MTKGGSSWSRGSTVRGARPSSSGCTHFRAAGRAAHRTCEPSGGPVGAMIRQILSHRMVLPGSSGGGSPGWETMALLFAADRLDHLEAEVRPALARGAMVISDRYDLSESGLPERHGPSLAILGVAKR